MTSVASFGRGTTAGNYTLIFSTARILDWVQQFNTVPARVSGAGASGINILSNFWSRTVVMDGRYPAIYYQHEFMLYREKNSRDLFAKDYNNLVDLITDLPASLTLNDGDTATVLADFGTCYFDSAAMKNPDALLLHAAGFINLKFVGSAKPTYSNSLT